MIRLKILFSSDNKNKQKYFQALILKPFEKVVYMNSIQAHEFWEGGENS